MPVFWKEHGWVTSLSLAQMLQLIFFNIESGGEVSAQSAFETINEN